jgi:hypothetical protein
MTAPNLNVDGTIPHAIGAQEFKGPSESRNGQSKSEILRSGVLTCAAFCGMVCCHEIRRHQAK